MAKKKTTNGKKNICGCKIKELRLTMPGSLSQQQLAEMLQNEGLNIGTSAIQKIEAGSRCMYDIELKVIAKVLNTTYNELLN